MTNTKAHASSSRCRGQKSWHVLLKMSAPEETVADDVAGAVKTYLVAGKIGFAECLDRFPEDRQLPTAVALDFSVVAIVPEIAGVPEIALMSDAQLST